MRLFNIKETPSLSLFESLAYLSITIGLTLYEQLNRQLNLVDKSLKIRASGVRNFFSQIDWNVIKIITFLILPAAARGVFYNFILLLKFNTSTLNKIFVLMISYKELKKIEMNFCRANKTDLNSFWTCPRD